MTIWACREMRPGFSFQSFLPGTISLRVTAQCPAKKDFHYNPSRMFFLNQKIIFYSEIVCASDCSENPFACSLQKIVAGQQTSGLMGRHEYGARPGALKRMTICISVSLMPKCSEK